MRSIGGVCQGVYDLDVPTPEQLRAITDPTERARAARAAQADLERQRDDLAAVVRESVREMRRTMTLAKVAGELGVTPGRVQQLEKPPTGGA